MATLQLASKARAIASKNPVTRLYRAVSKEVPRILTIYDIDLPVPEARQAVRDLFTNNGHIKDKRVVDMLVEKGYMDLEETLLQWKQRPHLIRQLEGRNVMPTGSQRKRPLTLDEEFLRS